MKTIEKIENTILYTTLFLLPLVVLSMFPNPYQTPKIVLVVVGVLIVLLLKIIKAFIRGSMTFTAGNFDIPVLLLAGAYIFSAWFKTPNKVEAFFLPGTATIIIVGALLYFIVNQLSQNQKKYVQQTLFASGIVISILMLLAGVGVLKSIPQLPLFMRVDDFSPLGGSLAGIIYLVATLPFGIALIRKQKDMALKAFVGIALVVISFSIILALFNILPGKNTLQMPSFGTSWSIAADALKESPLLGIGGGNYVTAFNRFRPLSYNATDLWTMRFTSARNLYLTVITETGLLGLAAIILLFVPFTKIYGKENRQKKLVGWHTLDNTNLVAFILLALLMALFPTNLVILIIFFVLLALNTEAHEMTFYTVPQGSTHASAKLPIIIVSLPVILLGIAVSYFGVRALAAEVVYKNALDAITKNDAQKGYNGLQSAINTNPYSDRYHTSYAQLNLALANAIAAKKELTDEERQTITQLIQQAIREGKILVTLNPQRATNWETLARIYQAIIPLAKDADSFAIQSMSQAVSLDPINPQLRIALGGLYFARKDYDSAVTVFELATALKQDLPNTHYNLAYALKEKGNIDRAIKEMSTVLSLTKKDSKDYETAQKALTEFESKKKETTPPQGTDNLTPPATPTDQLEPKLDLPEGSEPPQTPEEPVQASASGTPLP